MIKQYMTVERIFNNWERLIEIFRNYKVDDLIKIKDLSSGNGDDVIDIILPYYDITDFVIMDDKKFNKLEQHGLTHVIHGNEPDDCFNTYNLEYTFKCLDYKMHGLEYFVNYFQIYPYIAKVHSKSSDIVSYYLVYGFDMDAYFSLDNNKDKEDFLSSYDNDIFKLKRIT